MKDLQTKGTGNSRYLKSAIGAAATWEEARALLVNGTFPIDLAGINEAGILQIGDALNKATLLRDETAAMFGLGADAVPDDVFVELAAPDDLHTLVLQKITTSCKWTAPKAKDQEFTIFAVGGGGGSSGRGGGGGGYVEKAVVTIAEGTSVTVTCGAGGTPSANAGKSSFGSYVSANGGGRATSDAGAAGGAGGGGAYSSAGGAGSTYGGGGGGSSTGAGGAGGTYGGAGGKKTKGTDSPATVIPSLFTFYQLSHNFNTYGGKGGTGGSTAGGGGGGYGGNGGSWAGSTSGNGGGGGGGGYGGNGGNGGTSGGGGGGGGGFFGNGAPGTNSHGGGGGGFFTDGTTSSTNPAGGYGGAGGVLVMFFKED